MGAGFYHHGWGLAPRLCLPPSGRLVHPRKGVGAGFKGPCGVG